MPGFYVYLTRGEALAVAHSIEQPSVTGGIEIYRPAPLSSLRECFLLRARSNPIPWGHLVVEPNEPVRLTEMRRLSRVATMLKSDLLRNYLHKSLKLSGTRWRIVRLCLTRRCSIKLRRRSTDLVIYPMWCSYRIGWNALRWYKALNFCENLAL
jgi:hypothetical protein